MDASSFARLTFTSADLDPAERRQVVRTVLAVAAEFLTPTTPSAGAAGGGADEKETTDAYYAALRANRGEFPADQLARLRSQIVEASSNEPGQPPPHLLEQVPQLVNKTRQFDLLSAARTRASETLQTLSASEADASRGGPNALGISFVDENDPAATATESGWRPSPVRRGFAAGLAAALVLAGFTLAIAAGRARRERSS